MGPHGMGVIFATADLLGGVLRPVQVHGNLTVDPELGAWCREPWQAASRAVPGVMLRLPLMAFTGRPQVIA